MRILGRNHEMRPADCEQRTSDLRKARHLPSRISCSIMAAQRLRGISCGQEVFAAAVELALAACAGRDAQPVATVQPQDTQSDCAMINAEIQADNAKAEPL
jgi:type IV pilus biogenesis protein CpaD/CtpE